MQIITVLKKLLIFLYFCDKIFCGEFETILTERKYTPRKNKTTGENKKMKRKNSALFLTRGAAIATIYVILTYLSHVFGLASGVIQLRLSEALCVLPAFLSEAIPGLTLGCLISNLVTGCAPWDVVFGTLATLLGAIGARIFARLANKKKQLAFLIPLPTVISNTLIIPFVLRYAYGAPSALAFMILTVGIGELLSALVLGNLLYFPVQEIFKRK